MPLWLDLLKTPMAAPETPRLKAMRRTFQVLCIVCALGVTFITPLTALLGRLAPLGIAALLVSTAAYTALYVVRKNRADEAWLLMDRNDQGGAR
jgi:threonine/homoserine efflux transporter RhtA